MPIISRHLECILREKNIFFLLFFVFEVVGPEWHQSAQAGSRHDGAGWETNSPGRIPRLRQIPNNGGAVRHRHR